MKLFLSKEIKEVLLTLKYMGNKFDNFTSFGIVRNNAEKIILKNKDMIKEIMTENNISPERTAYSWINNVAGDLLESGKYHIYRETLNQTGNELLQIFDLTTDELVKLGDMTKEKAKQQKGNIRENIKQIG